MFVLPLEDERFVLVNDKNSPIYDERLDLAVSEELGARRFTTSASIWRSPRSSALSLAREGRIQPARVRKSGPKLETLEGRQRFGAALLSHEWVASGDSRVALRAGQPVGFTFQMVRPEDEQAAVRQILAANLRIDATPILRARRIARAMKWGLSIEEMQNDLVETMRQKAVMHGAWASRAVTWKKSGQAVTVENTAKRMLSREFLESYFVVLEEVRALGAGAVRTNLRLLLGDADALGGVELAPRRDAVQRARQK